MMILCSAVNIFKTWSKVQIPYSRNEKTSIGFTNTSDSCNPISPKPTIANHLDIRAVFVAQRYSTCLWSKTLKVIGLKTGR